MTTPTPPPQTPRPAPVRTDESNAFAHHTLQVRVPQIMTTVIEGRTDWPPDIKRRLDQLSESLHRNDPMPLLELPAMDYDDWAAEHATHAGRWQETEWFFAETYAYRLLIQAVRWWETGIDPFLETKLSEFHSASFWETLDRALAFPHVPLDMWLDTLLEFVLWGNRIDLSFAASRAHGSVGHSDDLLVDDRRAVVEYLLRRRAHSPNGPLTVHIVLDNTGTELATDLLLAHTLITYLNANVVLHPKMHPTFVSDATVADVQYMIQTLRTGAKDYPLIETMNAPDALQRTFNALYQAFETGQFKLAPDFYWNSSRFGWEMPDRIRESLRRADLVVVKGDANYRRLVDDALWEPDTPFAAAVDYFPAPVVALRTLKCETILGLPTGMAERLDQIDAKWRVNGKRGVIQAFFPNNVK